MYATYEKKIEYHKQMQNRSLEVKTEYHKSVNSSHINIYLLHFKSKPKLDLEPYNYPNLHLTVY